METKIIGLILLICAALLFQYSYDDFMNSYFSPGVKLKGQIEKDITTSMGDRVTEKKSDIHHVKFNYRSQSALEYLKQNPPDFKTDKDGTVWLEVEVVDLQDEETPGFITQTSIFDIKTNNKIGEFGSTYYISEFDKNKKPIPSPTSIPDEEAKPASTDKKVKQQESKPEKAESKSKE